MDRLKKFFANGLLMTAVSLAIRYISVSFNVYVTERIGASAMGTYTLIGGVYGFALTLATSGISLATTKLVSECLGERGGDVNAAAASVRAIMKKSLLLALTVSLTAAVGLFSAAPFIGKRLLGDPSTASSLRILALSLPPIAISSSLSGYFSALRKVHKNAIVITVGQAMRIFACILLLGRLADNGREGACIALSLGLTLSELLSFLLQGALYLLERRGAKAPVSPCEDKRAKRLVSITLPIAFSAYLRSALITVEHLLIPVGLEKSGVGRERSLAAYGTLHSLVFPFVLFPSAISSSFAGLLVPEVSESLAAGDVERIERIISRVLKTVLIYSIGVSAVMISLSRGIAEQLLGSSDSARYIALIAPLVPIMYLDTSVDSILKGLGHQLYSMAVNIADSLGSVVLVWILLPRLGITGYVVTVYFTELLNATLSITRLLCATKVRPDLLDLLIKPLLSAIVATRTVLLVAAHAPLLLQMILISVAYFALLMIFGALPPKRLLFRAKNLLKS